jgi:hypothetical protein
MKKINSLEKVYLAAKKLFKKGKELPVSKIAKVVKLSHEWTRLNVLKLVSKRLIRKDKRGRIIDVK